MSQGDVEAIQDGALMRSGAQMPSDVSRPLSQSHEELDMIVQALTARVEALEGILIGDYPANEPAGELDTLMPTPDELAKAMALLRRHFGADAI